MSGADPGSRQLAPDVARGLMLLLIAVANVAFWFPTVGATDTANQVFEFARSLLIDQRTYPLFAMLFGYGLGTIVSRRSADGVSGPPVRRLLRRRGWWMLLIGFAHGVLFGGDIIGTYGLIVVVIAGLVAGGRWRWLTALGIVVWLLAVASEAIAQTSSTTFDEAAFPAQPVGSVGWFLFNIAIWVSATPMAALLSVVVPATVLGLWLSRTTLLSRPEQHLRTLVIVAAGGLVLGAAGGAVAAAHLTGLADGPSPHWASGLQAATWLLTSVGWLAVIALVGAAARGRDAEKAFTPLGLVVATGRRSMTAYIGQTFVFLPFALLVRATGIGDSLTPILLAVVAALGWLVIAVVCAALQAAGRRGPFEVLLRTLVAESARQSDRAILAGEQPPVPPGAQAQWPQQQPPWPQQQPPGGWSGPPGRQ